MYCYMQCMWGKGYLSNDGHDIWHNFIAWYKKFTGQYVVWEGRYVNCHISAQLDRANMWQLTYWPCSLLLEFRIWIWIWEGVLYFLEIGSWFYLVYQNIVINVLVWNGCAMSIDWHSMLSISLSGMFASSWIIEKCILNTRTKQKNFFNSVIAISILTYKNNEDILKEISGQFVQRMTLKASKFWSGDKSNFKFKFWIPKGGYLANMWVVTYQPSLEAPIGGDG